MAGTTFRRIRLYLIGVIIGCILVYVTLIYNRDRNMFGWLPGNMIRSELQEKLAQPTDRTHCFLDCTGLSYDGLDEFIEEADVSMEESNPRGKPRTYMMVGTNPTGEAVHLKFSLPGDSARIIWAKVVAQKEACDC